MAAKVDIDTIRAAAAGRWPEIFSSLAALDGELLDGKHHPCPKCGGEDRFRAVELSVGALLCNQCFSSANGDGFSAIQWLLGVDFLTAADRVGTYLGVAKTGGRGGKTDPAKDLEWQPWSSALVAHLLAKKPGVTEAALLAAGARLAKYKHTYPVVALPVIGEQGDPAAPVGWVLMHAMGGLLPKWDKTGAVVGHVKTKLTYGSKPGLLGAHGIERLKAAGLAKVVWKVEGVSDLLALWSAIPEGHRDEHLVLSNANGAQESPKWMAAMLAAGRPLVLHDADEPGVAGAKKWSLDIARHGVDCTLVRLPYPVAETHGKDLRDWLMEGNHYSDLLTLADQGEVCKPTVGAPGEDPSAQFPMQELILSKLKLDVLYEDDAGRVRVFSTLLRKSSTIPAIEKLSHERLIQIAGPPAIEHIHDDPQGGDQWRMLDVRRAVALMASSRRGKSDDRGVGVWQGLADGDDADTLLLVNSSEAARWNGDKVLRRVTSPRADGLVLDFGRGEDWYDFDTLAALTAKAESSVEWREGVVDRAVDLFSRWRWGNDAAPQTMAGLVLATWVQTIWHWRPLVFVGGESNSGKSVLFESLGGREGAHPGLFGSLSLLQEKSSEAGVRQGIGNTAKVLMCDEFEAGKDRERILEMLRASSRGGTVRKGTSDQQSKGYVLRHIGWTAAIESGLRRQPDQNRFIRFSLLRAAKGQGNRLTVPPPSELLHLGQQLLAVAVVSAHAARRLAGRIKNHPMEGVPDRAVETYAVPAAMLATALGMGEDDAKRLLEALLAPLMADGEGAENRDHEELLEAILSAPVRCGQDGELTVAQILDPSSSDSLIHRRKLESCGVLERDGKLVIAYNLVSRRLLRDTPWHGQQIGEILQRLPGATRSRLCVAGTRPHAISLPIPDSIAAAD